MGLLTLIGAGAKAIFGVAQTPGADKVFEAAKGIGGWVDEQQFTPEERAEYHKQMVEQYAGYLAQVAAESTDRSITRRIIALYIIRVTIIWLTAAMALYPFNPDWSKFITILVTTEPWSLFLLGVGAFFFGTHLLRETGFVKVKGTDR